MSPPAPWLLALALGTLALRPRPCSGQEETCHLQATAKAGGQATLTAGRFVSRCRNQKRGQDGDAERAAPVKELVFIHVPRTGGTSIEDCSSKEEPALRWGTLNARVHGLTFTGKGFNKCYKQHVPPSMLPEVYGGTETFCVVRNPFDRAISQYGFQHAFFHGENDKNWACTAADLNRYLLDRLNTTLQNPYVNDCHLMPQSAYVFGWNATTREVIPSAASCTHVLRFEELYEGFNGLMASHGYPYRMNAEGTSVATRSDDKCRRLSHKDFTPEVRRLLLRVYAQDFELLRYPKKDAQKGGEEAGEDLEADLGLS